MVVIKILIVNKLIIHKIYKFPKTNNNFNNNNNNLIFPVNLINKIKFIININKSKNLYHRKCNNLNNNNKNNNNYILNQMIYLPLKTLKKIFHRIKYNILITLIITSVTTVINKQMIQMLLRISLKSYATKAILII